MELDEVGEGRFCLVLNGEGSTGNQVLEVLEKLVVGSRKRGWGVQWLRQKFHALFVEISDISLAVIFTLILKNHI